MGALLAYVFYPVYAFLLRKIKNETTSSLIVCVLVLIILLVPGFFLAKGLIQQSYVIFIEVKKRLAVGLFSNCTNSFCLSLKELGQNPAFSSQVQDIMKIVTNWVVDKASSFLISLPQTILNVFVAFFTMFYFMIDAKPFMKWLNELLSMQREKYFYVLKRLKEIVHGVVYGYVLVALVQGAFGALGFFLFGIPSPLFWGGVMTLVALVPYVGTGIIWIPASLILLLEGVFQDSNALIIKGIGLFIYSLIFVSSSDNFLRPKLMGHKAKVHPAVMFLGIIGGLSLFGILGLIIGPLVLSLTAVLINIYIVENRKILRKK